MEQAEMMAVLEAVLFAHGDPVGAGRLAAALDWPESLVLQGLDALQARCMQPDSGLTLLRLGDHWQLATGKVDRLAQLFSPEQELSATVATFLAVLELVRSGRVAIAPDGGLSIRRGRLPPAAQGGGDRAGAGGPRTPGEEEPNGTS